MLWLIVFDSGFEGTYAIAVAKRNLGVGELAVEMLRVEPIMLEGRNDLHDM